MKTDNSIIHLVIKKYVLQKPQTKHETEQKERFSPHLADTAGYCLTVWKPTMSEHVC